MFYIKLMQALISFESSQCTQQRLNGKFVMRITSVIFLLFASLYAASPADLLPEGCLNCWVAYIDDVILCAAMVCYVIADLTAALEGRKLGRYEILKDSSENE